MYNKDTIMFIVICDGGWIYTNKALLCFVVLAGVFIVKIYIFSVPMHNWTNTWIHEKKIAEKLAAGISSISDYDCMKPKRRKKKPYECLINRW